MVGFGVFFRCGGVDLKPSRRLACTCGLPPAAAFNDGRQVMMWKRGASHVRWSQSNACRKKSSSRTILSSLKFEDHGALGAKPVISSGDVHYVQSEIKLRCSIPNLLFAITSFLSMPDNRFSCHWNCFGSRYRRDTSTIEDSWSNFQ